MTTQLTRFEVPRASVDFLEDDLIGRRKLTVLKCLALEKTKNKIEYFYSEPSKSYINIAYLRVSDKLIKDENTEKYLKKFPKWVEKRLILPD